MNTLVLIFYKESREQSHIRLSLREKVYAPNMLLLQTMFFYFDSEVYVVKTARGDSNTVETLVVF